ncbi:helix-turn-helix domain-containing protein [Corynebacterium amycolatum]|uniref:helix-turn-helix domain-containing protein n=1 Tax=Corynebacterium amycolatum TaxID=43765 RepID=UPI00211A5EE7|nr:helix-turn-helix domain-containing protein [Corynebacterium amycolatum]MCQ9167470.1 helix-turn-helix domain-containing protein [Corynebacterium amycolatum]MCQ9173719.1 helix-turn-helix domain-containing protein [Corynebacterium amycolatum]
MKHTQSTEVTMTARRRTLTPREFADEFGIDVQRVYRWCQAGRLRTMPKTPGSRQHWRIFSCEVDRVMTVGFPSDPREAA